MARRETIRRQDCDGTTRPHEIELNHFRCRALDGTNREMTIESDSAFDARQKARMAFGIEQVEIEMIEPTTLPAPPSSSLEKMGEVLKKMSEGASENSLVVGPLADAALSPDHAAALRRLQDRAKGKS
jgi:hypothetical protein